MRKKLVILMFILASGVVFMPSRADAAGSSLSIAAGNSSTMVQPKFKKGKFKGNRGFNGDRGRHLGWYKGRRAYWYAYDPYDSRYVRRVYYVNSRPVIRWVWTF
jgi:hypothetical protein